MNDSYEVNGNQIKYYLRDDLTRGWNNIPSPQYGVGLDWIPNLLTIFFF